MVLLLSNTIRYLKTELSLERTSVFRAMVQERFSESIVVKLISIQHVQRQWKVLIDGSPGHSAFSHMDLASNIGLDGMMKKDNTSGCKHSTRQTLLQRHFLRHPVGHLARWASFLYRWPPSFLNSIRGGLGRRLFSMYLKIISSLKFLSQQNSFLHLSGCFSTAVQSILRYLNCCVRLH